MKNNKISFIASNITEVSDPSQKQFATLKIDAFASGDNLHNIFISDETLYKTAHTIINKPLLWAYNQKTDDIGGHDPTEVPCGVIPESNQLTFSRTEDGRTMLSVIARVWKQYSGYLLDFFKRDGSMKPVSVEMEVLETQRRENGVLELTDFSYTGVTILGSQLIPAIPGAKALVLNFAEATDAYNKAYLEEFGAEQKLGVENKLEEGQVIVEIEQPVEETIEVEEELNDEAQGELADVVEETSVDPVESEQEPQDEESDVEETVEDGTVELEQTDVLQPVREAFAEDESLISKLDAEDYKGVIEALFAKLGELEVALASLKESNEQLEFSKDALLSFKEEIEKEQLDKEIASVVDSVKDVVSEDELNALLESSKEYNLENIKEWKNAAQAAAYRATQNSKPQQKPEVIVPVSEQTGKKKSGGFLWD